MPVLKVGTQPPYLSVHRISIVRLLALLLHGMIGSVLLLVVPDPSIAGIGGLRPQVLEDARTHGFTLVRTDQRSTYSALTFKREEVAPSGAPPRQLTVREFLDTRGRSFGVAWKGSIRPNFSSILGPLVSHLPKVIHSQDRHRLFFRDSRLEITIVGTPRFQVGRALDLKNLPPGIQQDEIRVSP